MASSRVVSGLVFAAVSALVGLSACSGGPSSIGGGGDGGASSTASGNEDASAEACTATCPPGDAPTPHSGLKLVVSNPITSDVLVNYISNRASAGFAAAGNRFVVMTVQIENVGIPEPVSTTSDHFSLKTAQGIVYQPWSGTGRIPNNCVGRGSVAQGGKSQPCDLAFELSVLEQPSALLYATSSSESGRASAPMPAAKAAPPAFCELVNLSEGAVSQACIDCVQSQCSLRPSVELPPGTCPAAPYCLCERQAYDLRGQGGSFAALEGCIDTTCAAVCIPR